MHSQGTEVNHIRMTSGAYNMFQQLNVDGFKCTHSVISLDNTDTLTIAYNSFNGVACVDMVPPTPDTREAALYLGGTVMWITLSKMYESMHILRL